MVTFFYDIGVQIAFTRTTFLMLRIRAAEPNYKHGIYGTNRGDIHYHM